MAQTQRDLTANSDPLDRILHNIHELGLDRNLIELETKGYTTVPGVLSEHQIEQAMASIIARAEHAVDSSDSPWFTGEAGSACFVYLKFLVCRTLPFSSTTEAVHVPTKIDSRFLVDLA